MPDRSPLTIRLDKDGHLEIPEAILQQFGLVPGAKVRLEPEGDGFHISRSTKHLARIYVEPTNACNLDCRTCMRNVWDEAPGQMAEGTFDRILEGIQAVSPRPLMFFGGIGEPLAHPGIIGMVRAVRQAGAEAELITNGTLLDRAMLTALVESGLNRLWVSLDGASAESYADVRLGAALQDVIDNLSLLYRLRFEHPNSVIKLGIAFVAMRRNIAGLPAVIRLGKRLGADQFSISNVLSHTAEMRQEILYRYSLYESHCTASHWSPEVDFPRMDLNRDVLESLSGTLDGTSQLLYRGQVPGPARPSCPFFEKGSLSIRWDGLVSACLPLLHTHAAYLDDRMRQSYAHFFGNINQTSLVDIWESAIYTEFRERLLAFDFSPCVVCNSCEMADANLEDCFGNEAPTCGGCLWAQGFIRCP